MTHDRCLIVKTERQVKSSNLHECDVGVSMGDEVSDMAVKWVEQICDFHR